MLAVACGSMNQDRQSKEFVEMLYIEVVVKGDGTVASGFKYMLVSS